MRLKFALSVVMSLAVGIPMAHAQNFSCSFGDRGACLGYGDTVCSSNGKCVNSDAQCFSRSQCGYDGFTCKSNVTKCFERNDELIDKYNVLLSRNDELVDKYNALLSRNNELVGKYNVLLDEYDALASKAKQIAELNERLNTCLSSASTMDDVQSCIYYQ